VTAAVAASNLLHNRWAFYAHLLSETGELLQIVFSSLLEISRGYLWNSKILQNVLQKMRISTLLELALWWKSWDVNVMKIWLSLLRKSLFF
jgi:hypothetical protein